MEKILKRLGNLIYEIDNDKKTMNSTSNELSEIYQALQLLQPDVSGSLPSQELIEMLKECRDLLAMCTLIDKSGHCKAIVDKVDTKMGWQ